VSESRAGPIDPASGPSFALRGRIAQMTTTDAVIDDGVIYVGAGSIATVAEANAPPPPGFEQLDPLDTQGTIYPGLIDLHDHLSYNALQLWDVPKRYTNRDQWSAPSNPDYRKLVTGPMKVLAHTPAYVPAIVRYVEAKCLVAGTTTAQGIALSSYAGIQHFYRGIVRNVEQTDDPDLPEAGTHIADVVAKDRAKFLKRLKQFECLLLHLSEGTDDAARNHFLALQSANGDWAVWQSLAAIHCAALSAQDFDVLAHAKASMVWSPLSNLLLYGQTADIKAAAASGLTIALGPDWSPSGSKNLLGELKIARLAADAAKAKLTDFDLLSLATRNPARILHWDHELGTIEAGKRADLLVVAGTNGDAHSHLLTRSEHDVELVVINGFPRYGASQPMRRLLGDAASEAEAATIAGRQRLLDLRQPTADPDTGKLTLKAATSLLEDALSRLPELAKSLATRPALDLLEPTPGEAAPRFLVLDHDDLAGEDLRPHLPDRHGDFTAEPSPEIALAPSTPLADLLEPLTLDPLTAHDDSRLVTLLAKERNLPKEIAAAIPDLY
jgi:cytosine/adenosine deaminase-related metal-dependent hydrolase